MKTSRVIELALATLSSTIPLATASSDFFDSAALVLGTLVERDANVCGNAPANYTSCGQGLPTNFCCGPATTCSVFNNKASVICCPAGRSCNTIRPIPCSLDNLNATLFPTNPLHTTQLTGNLPTCGASTCCPAGYDCNNNECVLHGSASSSSASPSASSTSSSKPSSTSSSSSSSATSSASASATPPSGAKGNSTLPAVCSNSCDKFPITAVLAGFFPGILAGILLTIGTIVCLGRRKPSSDGASDDFGNVRAKISDPIYQENNSIRTDFIRRAKGLTRSPRAEGFSSPKTYELASPFQGAANVKTPENVVRRPPSTESITIYSPPDARGAARQTTFTEMLQNAGFKHNDTFLGSPGRVDPRVRDLTGSIR